jgi:putative flippase GtrA
VSNSKQSKLLNKKDFIAYFLVAGTGAIVQLVSGSILRNNLNLSYGASVSYGYIISFFVGFTLTKMFAFDARNSNQTRREMVKFMMVAAGSWGVTWFFAVGSLSFVNNLFKDNVVELPIIHKTINANELGCQVVGMGFSFIFNYIMHKTFTFKSTGFYNRLKKFIK